MQSGTKHLSKGCRGNNKLRACPPSLTSTVVGRSGGGREPSNTRQGQAFYPSLCLPSGPGSLFSKSGEPVNPRKKNSAIPPMHRRCLYPLSRVCLTRHIQPSIRPRPRLRQSSPVRPDSARQRPPDSERTRPPPYPLERSTNAHSHATGSGAAHWLPLPPALLRGASQDITGRLRFGEYAPSPQPPSIRCQASMPKPANQHRD